MKKWVTIVAWTAMCVGLVIWTPGCCSVYPSAPWCDQPDPDPIPTNGACCLPDGMCIEGAGEAYCAYLNGVWHAGADCSTVLCPQPEPTNAPPPPPPPTNATVEILAFMDSACFQDLDGDRVQKRLETIAGHFRDLYAGLVTVRPENRALRPYTGPMRNPDGSPTPLFLARYEQVCTNGIRPMVWIDQHPSVRNGEGQYLVPPCTSDAELFGAARLELNKRFLRELLAYCIERRLPQPYGIAPILEPTSRSARQREEEMVNYGISIGYSNWWIMTSPSYHWRDPARKVLSAGSTGSFDAWKASTCDVRSSDGDRNVSTPVSVTQRVCLPGPMGSIIWSPVWVGGESGPGAIPGWATDGVPCGRTNEPAPDGITRRAVIVGILNTTDGRNPCPGADVDADKLMRASEFMQSRTLLRDGAVTQLAVERALLDANADMSPTDRLFLGWSGHGTDKPDESGDDLHGRDQGLLLGDGTILWDDAFWAMVLKLRECRFQLWIDTCHADTIWRALGRAVTFGRFFKPRYIQLEFDFGDKKFRGEWGGELIEIGMSWWDRYAFGETAGGVGTGIGIDALPEAISLTNLYHLIEERMPADQPPAWSEYNASQEFIHGPPL